MEQHPIPRQITSFEFKLIGFMTLRQFLYLVVFIPLGLVTYFLFPIPFLNIILGVLVSALGVFIAFFPIYDRPVDVWIKNLIKKLTKPTQYFFSKNNPPIYFLSDLVFVSDPHRTASHIESKEKLAAYLAQKKTQDDQLKKNIKHKQLINSLFKRTTTAVSSTNKVSLPKKKIGGEKLPFFFGYVKNHQSTPLSNILIYVKDKNGQVVRLLKTNPYGAFATFNQLPPDEYFFEVKDPNSHYFFDRMKMKINNINQQPIEIISKELI